MISELIHSKNIKKACIVDDANDKIPTVADMTNLQDEWNIFLDDLHTCDDLLKRIEDKFEGFSVETSSLENLDDSFIELLWLSRDEFPELLLELFTAYDTTKLADNRHVNSLRETLQYCGFEVELVGRNFASSALKADIVFIDLYLHQDQTKDNLEYTSKIIREDIIKVRQGNPPIFILISRSERLDEYREKFREHCGLIESSFHIYRKDALHDREKLIFCIKRLIEYYADSLRVWNFLNSWELHADQAVKDTVNILKKIDLLDHNVIHNLLLASEGQSTASYFLELFDSILIHNFESKPDIINCAIELNDMDFSKVPTLQSFRKQPLQDLVYKSSFLGKERWRINTNSIDLGDIFKVKIHSDDSESTDYLFSSSVPNSVWLVITPSCDLVRDGVENIGLLKGVLTGVNANNWNTSSTKNTPIVQIDGTSYSILWNIKSFMTYPRSTLLKYLSDGTLERVAKMREVNALGIQQQFLADFGRVGQRAALPSVFKVVLEVAYLDSNDELIKFDGFEQSDTICYVGPKGEQIVNFSQSDFDNIIESIRKVDVSNISSHAKRNFTALQNSPYTIVEALENGVIVKSDLFAIKSRTGEEPSSNGIAHFKFGAIDDIPTSEKKKIKATGVVLAVSLVQVD